MSFQLYLKRKPRVLCLKHKLASHFMLVSACRPLAQQRWNARMMPLAKYMAVSSWRSGLSRHNRQPLKTNGLATSSLPGFGTQFRLQTAFSSVASLSFRPPIPQSLSTVVWYGITLLITRIICRTRSALPRCIQHQNPHQDAREVLKSVRH